jgi:hypothetical protein
VGGSCEHGNEPSGFIKYWEFFELLSNCWFLKNYSATWSWLLIVTFPLYFLGSDLSNIGISASPCSTAWGP